MPIYEYICKKCGKKFEVKIDITDELKQTICPSCKKQLDKNEFEKLVSKSTFILKFDTNY